MWIFITAVFLVLFFMFYRHPAEMFKATGALVVILALAGLAVFGIDYWNQPTVEEQAAQTPQQQALQKADAAWRESWAEQERQKKQEAAAQLAEFEARREVARKNVKVIATLPIWRYHVSNVPADRYREKRISLYGF